MATNKKKTRRNRWRVTFSILGVLFLVLGCAYFLSQIVSIRPAQDATQSGLNLNDLFSGASSLALLLISIVIALAALVQWPAMKADVRKEIEESQAAQRSTRAAMIRIQRRLDQLADRLEKQFINLEMDTKQAVEAFKAAEQEQFSFLKEAISESASQTAKEVRARGITTMGFLVGTLHSDPWAEIQEEKNKEHLAEAVHLCQKGYDDLKEVKGEGVYMALNNLVYYSTLLRIDEKSDLILKQSRELKNYTKGAKYAAFYILTFCRAVGTYGTDLGELKEAHFLADQISTSDDVTTMTRKEATYLVALIQKRIEIFASQTTRDPNRSGQSK